MTRYLLDTDVLIDFSKGVEPVSERLLGWIDGTDSVGVCAVSVAEFYSGLPAERGPEWETFFRSLTYWDIPLETAMQAGQDRYRQSRSGRTVTTTDALLSAAARFHGATLVTTNLKDFPGDDLVVLSIR